MDKQQKVIVPIAYDTFENYYAEPEDNKYLYFLKGNKYELIYDVTTAKLYPMASYDKIYDTYLEQGYLLVLQNGLTGLIRPNGKIALPIVYSRINHLYKKGRHYYAKVEKEGKEEEVKLLR